jgi:hypothetical protein
MRAKQQAFFRTSLIVGVMLALSACGVTTGSGGPAGTPGSPDSLRIEIDAPGPTMPPGTKPVLTLTDASMVQRLYAAIYALPTMPADLACTAERGPHYTLTFRRSATTLATVQANRDGCRPVTIAGATPVRQGTSAFWQQLDQTILAATPSLTPDRLVIAYTPHSGQAPQTAQITSATTVRQFYDAILALPKADSAPNCSPEPVPTHQFVFFAGSQSVPAFVDDACQTVAIEGGYQSRGGAFAMSDPFRGLLHSLLAGATFAPARPDHLTLSIAKDYTTSSQINVGDTQIMLALYDRVSTLPQTPSQPGCPPDSDKINHKGTFMTFSFTQWSLPIAQFSIYEGSCSFVQWAITGQWLRADPAFWDLVHRALAQ